MTQMPGYIKFDVDSWYQRYPDLDERIVSHIEEWRDSVPVEYVCTIDAMLNFKRKLGDPGHGMPIEIVSRHVFPEDGPCAIEGVEGISDTSPKKIMRTA